MIQKIKKPSRKPDFIYSKYINVWRVGDVSLFTLLLADGYEVGFATKDMPVLSERLTTKEQKDAFKDVTAILMNGILKRYAVALSAAGKLRRKKKK